MTYKLSDQLAQYGDSIRIDFGVQEMLDNIS